MNDYSTILSTISGTMSWLEEQAVVPEDLREVPTFNEVRGRKNLYDAYGRATMVSYEVADAISRAYVLRTQLRDLLKATRMDRDTPRSLLAPFQAEIEHKQAQLNDLILALLAKKDGVDTMVRFYSSTQYILGSPRLEGLS